MSLLGVGMGVSHFPSFTHIKQMPWRQLTVAIIWGKGRRKQAGVGQVTQLLSHKPSPAGWQTKRKGRIKTGHLNAYIIGRGANLTDPQSHIGPFSDIPEPQDVAFKKPKSLGKELNAPNLAAALLRVRRDPLAARASAL